MKIMILIIGIVAFLVLMYKYVNFLMEDKEKTWIIKEIDLDYQLNTKVINKNADYKWHNYSEEKRYHFITDENAKKVFISYGFVDGLLEEIPYEEIIGFEILEDSQIVGGIKRAIVGGILAGGAGAIVGSLTAKEKAITSLQAVLYRENINSPKFMFDLINLQTNTTDPRYIEAKEFLGNINATIKAIIAKAEHSNRPAQQSTSVVRSVTNNNDEVMERLQKLKTAFENDLITETEYKEKKKELLETI